MANLIEVSHKISDCITAGNLSIEVLKLLLTEHEHIQTETVLWDFKREYPSDALSWGKIIRSVAAFHNAYGGYIVFGVRESDEGCFDLLGIGDAHLRQEHLRDLIDKYIDQKPACTVVSLDFRGFKLALLHVPKRSTEKPAFFIRNGPESKPGAPVFRKHQAYVRSKDQSKPAQEPEDWHFLYGERSFLTSTSDIFESKRQIEFVNAPNRSLICPKFVGRKRIISSLWEWIGDEFEAAKVIAGEGGKGKTSIAYEFATQFSSNPLHRFQQIVWLSAKRKQFSGFQNEWVELPEVHYSDFQSLLRAFADSMPISPDLDLKNDIAIKTELKNCFREYPSLMIIDDVDSLDPNDQKRVLELSHQIAADSKFLFTTRVNASFSTDMSVTIPGFPEEEYEDYLEMLGERFRLEGIGKYRPQLYLATDGSPLLTESILRLVRLGEPVPRAIAGWKHKDGEDARAAALEREIENLSRESRRVLLALAYFKEASQTELLQALGFRKPMLERCLGELSSLFLVDVRQITEEEPRIGISVNAQSLVLEKKEKLVADFNRLFNDVKKVVSGSRIRRGNATLIGSTINQAVALLKQGESARAIQTVQETLKSQKDHPDLLLMLARCHLSRDDHEDLTEARKLLQKASECGQKRSLFFELWYEAEKRASYPSGMTEVSQKALDQQVGDAATWLYRLANGHYMGAHHRMSGNDFESALIELDRASESLVGAIRIKATFDQDVLYRTSRGLHDYVLDVLDRKRAESSEKIDWILRIIRRGDRRTKFYSELVDLLELLRRDAARGSAKLKSVFNSRFSQSARLFEKAKSADHWGVVSQGLSERFSILEPVDLLP